MKPWFPPPWVLWAAAALSAVAALLVVSFVDASYGVPNLFYVPLVFASMAGGRRAALVAAPALTAAFVTVIAFSTDASVAALTTVGATRLAVSLLIGLMIGSNVDYNRQLVRTALGRANRDSLTGLGTRHALEERWLERDRAAGPFGIVMIDMDELKEINDRDGHAAGDMALRTLADSIRRGSRSRDTLARIGGDEFVVLADLESRGELESLAWRIERDANRHGVEASIGIALFPDDGADLTGVLEIADRRMYARKLEKQANVAALRPRKAG